MGDLAWTCPEPDDFDADRRGVTRWYRDGRVMRIQDVGVAVRATMPVVLDSGHPAALAVRVGVDDRDHRVHARFEAGWGGSPSAGTSSTRLSPGRRCSARRSPLKPWTDPNRRR
ncbi:hypothetical protein [Lentzea sp. NPDC055074]